MSISTDELKRLVPLAQVLGTSAKTISCPLPGHDDKHESCAVDHGQGLWHCFACNEGGDLFNLLMARDRLTFKEALREVAAMAGVTLEAPTEEAQARWELTQRLFAARRYAVDFYQAQLFAHQGAMAYLQSRGFTDRVISEQKLGYAGAGQPLLAHLKTDCPKDLSLEDFVLAGLLGRADDGRLYDYFSEPRLLFPLLVAGRVENISGRSAELCGGAQKYKHLRGLEITHFYNEDALRTSDSVWVFEGHPDTLSAIELGLPAVGVIGTSGMTRPEKLGTAREVWICGDADAPGKKAVENWARLILKHNGSAKIWILSLPDGVKDFNDWFKANRGDGLREAFGKLKAGAKTLLEHVISRLTVETVADAWPFLESVTESQRAEAYKRIRAALPTVSVSALEKDFKTWKKARDAEKPAASLTVTGVDYRPQAYSYMNVDFAFRGQEASAHVCLYGYVTLQDEEGRESRKLEPVLIRSTVTPGEDGYKAQELLVSDLQDPDRRTIPDRSIILARGSAWSAESVQKFLSGQAVAPKTGDLIRRIADLFKTYIWYKDPSTYELLAIYVMGTYVSRVFGSYPYLTINGLKRTGKSNTLELLYHLCFNATMAVNSSISATFRMIQSSFATWIRDEAEQFNAKTPENADELTILNAGYKKGSTVNRIEKNKDGGMEVMSFDVFSPKVFGGINVVNTTLLDRSILIKSHRAASDQVVKMPRMNQCRNQWEADAAALRDDLYTWMLTHFDGVREVYLSFPPDEDIINREWELWLPLMTIAAVADAEDEADYSKPETTFSFRLRAAAKVKSKEKKQIEQEESAEANFIEGLLGLINDQAVSPVFNELHRGFYVAHVLAKKLTETLREQGLYKHNWELSPRRLLKALEQAQVINRDQEDVKRIKADGRTTVCVRLLPERLEVALGNL